jgi:hypothetical protein
MALARGLEGAGQAGEAVGLQAQKQLGELDLDKERQAAIAAREETLARLQSSLKMETAQPLADIETAGKIKVAQNTPRLVPEAATERIPGQPDFTAPRTAVPVTPEAAALDRSRSQWLDEQRRRSEDEGKALTEARAAQALAKAAGPQGIDRKTYNDVTSQIYRDMPRRKDAEGNDISPDQEELSSRQALGAQVLRADPSLSAAEVAQRALSAPLMTRRMAIEQATKEMEKAPKVGMFSWGTDGPRGSIDVGGGKSLSPEDFVKQRSQALIDAKKGELEAWSQSNGIASRGGAQQEQAPVPGARKGNDGNWYVESKDKPGTYARVDPAGATQEKAAPAAKPTPLLAGAWQGAEDLIPPQYVGGQANKVLNPDYVKFIDTYGQPPARFLGRGKPNPAYRDWQARVLGQ